MAAISFSQCWPYFGQRVHFAIFQTEPNPSVQARYQRLSNDIFAVLDRHLSQHAFFAGTEYSIANIALFGWTRITLPSNGCVTFVHRLSSFHIFLVD